MVTVYRITDVSDERIKSYKHLNRLTDITNYIKENYEGDISLESLAKIFGYSPTYLSKMFQKYAKVSYREYLQSIRLERACAELVNTNHMLGDIAINNGFANSKAFAKAFKKEAYVNKYSYDNFLNSEGLPEVFLVEYRKRMKQ